MVDPRIQQSGALPVIPFQPAGGGAYSTALEMFEAARDRAADLPALHYLDEQLSYAQVDQRADALAAYLQHNGVQFGDRVALYLQNIPEFLIALIATWKLGAIAVMVNPMNKARELTLLMDDCQPAVLVCGNDQYQQVVSQLPLLTQNVLVVLSEERSETAQSGQPSVVVCMPGIVAAWQGQRPLSPVLSGDDTATIVYTSGTTGVPKGVEHSHAAFVFNSVGFKAHVGLEEHAAIMGMAPLCHVTGLVLHIGIALACAGPLVLIGRFDPESFAQAVQRHHVTFAIGAITAFIALLNCAEVTAQQMQSLHYVYSGGAPIPRSVVDAYAGRFGQLIRGVYGLTESTSVAVAVPRDLPPASDAQDVLSVGKPAADTEVQIVDEAGQVLPSGQVGEIVIRGPQLMRGYWGRARESQAALLSGFLRTGDVGYLDAEGWLFLVDRMKDVIIASGFKVWPREVEDVLYSHPDVREAAVIGIKDDYRGESVKAFVSLKTGTNISPETLIEFCKARMAAYKYPRSVEVLEELPKTASGKIMRKALR